MAITFSVFTKPWKKQSPQALARLLRGMGFDGVEFPLRPGYQAEPEDAEVSLPRLARQLSEEGLTITSVASVLTEPVFAGCAGAGVPLIRIMVGHDLHKDFYDDLGAQVRALCAAAPLCERYGVKVGIQHHYGPGVNNSMELMWLLNQMDPRYFGAVWDAAHSALAGEEPEQALDILWPRLLLANLKNARYRRLEGEPAAYTREFVPGDQGQSDWARVARALQARRYRGVLCLTAEYTDEDRVDEYTARDLALARQLFAQGEA